MWLLRKTISLKFAISDIITFRLSLSSERLDSISEDYTWVDP